MHVGRVWRVEVRAVEVRVMAVRVMAVRAVAVSSAGALQPPREAHQEGSGLVWASFPIPGVNVSTGKLGRVFDLNCCSTKLLKQPGERANPV